MRVKDLVSKSRWRSVSIYFLRFLYNKLSKKLTEIDGQLDTLKKGDTIVLTEEIKNKLNRIDDFEQIWIIEQYMYRFLSCKPCVLDGKCVHCKCAIPARMFVRTDHCSKHYWPEFKKTEEEWNEYKRLMNFELLLNYKTVK